MPRLFEVHAPIPVRAPGWYDSELAASLKAWESLAEIDNLNSPQLLSDSDLLSHFWDGFDEDLYEFCTALQVAEDSHWHESPWAADAHDSDGVS